MPDPIGYRRWAIAEGHLSAEANDTACILNASDDDAHLLLTVYFSDRDPAGPYELMVGARRTLHLRYSALDAPEPIPRETPYASVIESDVPVVVQYSRVDGPPDDSALASTIAYAGD
jgi:hypothetical protein